MLVYKSTTFPRVIHIYGCGGTGSRLVPLVAQFIKTLPHVINPEIHLYDFDTIEDKNLNRQNFVKSDIGKNKAEVLAARYAKAYGVNIISHDSSPENVSLVYDESVALHILCVDSVKSRLDIYRNIRKTTGDYEYLLIDTGNGNDFGQVKLMGGRTGSVFSKDSVHITRLVENKKIPYSIVSPKIFNDPDYFELMEEAKTVTSCADMDQTMAINVLVASVAFSVIQNIYFAKDIDYHRIDIGLESGCVYRYTDFKYLSDIISEKRYEYGIYTLDKLLEAAYTEFLCISSNLEKAA